MLTRRCPAKLNLFLEVTGKRPDGYHDIESVFCPIPLADTLSAEPHPGTDILLDCSDPALPVDGRNLVVRAADALRQRYGVTAGIRFRLDKAIPAGSGLGGGSSDAAAALRLADAVWGTAAPEADLLALAAGIGADVPFFLYGGACLCRGIGDDITPLSRGLPEGARVGLVLPPVHSDTAAAYRGLALPDAASRRRADGCLAALERGDVRALGEAAFNRFEPTVLTRYPDVARLREGMEARAGRPVRMTGSGSGLWFVLEPGAGADDAPAWAAWAAEAGARFLLLDANPVRKA